MIKLLRQLWVEQLLQLVNSLVRTKAVVYSSYALVSCCARVIYDLVFAVLTRWLLSVRALLVGVVLRSSRRKAVLLDVLKKFAQ